MYIPEIASRFPANADVSKQFHWGVIVPGDNYSRTCRNFITFSVVLSPHDNFETDQNKRYIIDFEANFVIHRNGEGEKETRRRLPLPVYRRDMDKIHQIFIDLPEVHDGDVICAGLGRKGLTKRHDTFDGHMTIWGGSIDVHMDWEMADPLPSISPVAEREPFHIRMN